MIHPPHPSIQVQSDQYIPVEDIHGEMSQLEKQLDELEHRGVELEKKLRDDPNGNTLACNTSSKLLFVLNSFQVFLLI